MEEEIEIGEYGRTNKGKIFIFAWLENSDGKRYTNKVLLGNGKIFENKFYYFDDGEKIVKHSKQLIDLIEVGDIVKDKYNKYEVAFVKDDKIYCNDYNLDDSLITLREQDIKAILVREQFEAKCYKVGGCKREINKRCISRKEYLKKYDSNVGYALYVQDNIRKEDYVKLNTGNIVKVIGIKANTVNKRAIYYGFYKQDWFDSAAVENFSDNKIDLIEVGDFVNGYRVENVINEEPCPSRKCVDIDSSKDSSECTLWEEDIKTILTKEQYMANCYKVGGEDE